MSLPHSSQPLCPIQRLVIFHLNLTEKCLNGQSLGEGASLEELHEQILLYHRDQRSSEDDDRDSINVSYQEDPADLMEEAVQFVGLCTALHSLPASLGDDELKDDRTKEVYFGDSSLVFVPLEGSSDLIAVAQVSRLYFRGSRSDIGGGNPYAVLSSIERCHLLFCLFHGGGILHRLQLPSPHIDTETSSPYPHMDQLYKLRKELRKLQSKSFRFTNSSEEEQATRKEEGDRLEVAIATLATLLPIQSLRRDLSTHYSEYLGDLSVLASRIGGASRCLVETIPAPIALSSGLHVSRCAPSFPTTYCAVNVGLAIRQILEDIYTPSTDDVRVVGVSTFLQGQIQYTHISQPTLLAWPDTFQEAQHVEISNETACLVMGYMASYRSKINQHAPPSHTISLPLQSQPRLGLKRLTFSFGNLKDQAPQNLSKCDEVAEAEVLDAIGCFLSPPPLFMLSSSDRIHALDGPNNSKVWAPWIHLPLSVTRANVIETLSIDVHVIMFEIGDFSFLVYLGPQKDELAADDATSNGFQYLEELALQLSDAVFFANGYGNLPDTQTDSNDKSFEVDSVGWNEPGQDIIVVNRSKNRLILFSDRKQSAAKSRNKPKSPARNPRRRFLSFSSSRSSQSDDSISVIPEYPRSSDSDWSALGLDCRHRLASHLPLDIVLAFDDIMNELHDIKLGKEIAAPGRCLLPPPSPKISNQDGCLELCTSMRQGWIYAYAKDEHELYAFFDSSIYVTVADVQNAAHRTRKQLLGDWSF